MTNEAPPEAPTGFVRIPISDVTLAEASAMVEDKSWFESTRIHILYHFPQVTVDGYWELTVHDHTEMVGFLKVKGLLDG